jgi:hypothetical protein
VSTQEPLALSLGMTAVLLLLRPQGPPVVQTAQMGIAAVLLFGYGLRGRAHAWLAAAAIVATRIAWDWPLADNHIYLLAYWCLAIGLALGAPNPTTTLQASGRWLLAAAFTFAVLWKGLLSPDFIDGRFFRMTLIVDARFEDLVRLTTGMSLAEIDRHRMALAPLGAGATLAVDESLVEPPALGHLALGLTWGGLLLEAAIAAAFLAPLRARRVRIRHALLILFCVATYPIAPVAGFGWLLLAIGVVSAETSRWRAAYVGAWLIVLAGTTVPWTGWLADALARS